MSSTPNPRPLRWVKSTYSGGEGQCIEWAREHAPVTGEFLVRDSKNPAGPQLRFTASAFIRLVEFAKRHG